MTLPLLFVINKECVSVFEIACIWFFCYDNKILPAFVLFRSFLVFCFCVISNAQFALACFISFVFTMCCMCCLLFMYWYANACRFVACHCQYLSFCLFLKRRNVFVSDLICFGVCLTYKYECHLILILIFHSINTFAICFCLYFCIWFPFSCTFWVRSLCVVYSVYFFCVFVVAFFCSTFVCNA